MADTQVYVYFNEKGELVSKLPYVSTGVVRQGTDFDLNILFDENTNLIENKDLITLSFKCPGETDYNIFPFISYRDDNLKNLEGNFNFVKAENITFKENLSKYGIQSGTYQRYIFSSTQAFVDESGVSKRVLTEKDGNLEVQITLYSGDNSISKTGTFKIFIEKTLNYESPFNVSQVDLERFFNQMERITRIRGYGINAFYIDQDTGELILKAERSDDLSEGNYEINEKGELIIKI